MKVHKVLVCAAAVCVLLGGLMAIPALAACESPTTGWQAAIENAPAGSTVCLDAGTYTTSSTIDVPSKVTVTGPVATTIQRGYAVDPEPTAIIKTTAQVGISAKDDVTLRWLDLSGATGASSCIPGCGRGIESGVRLRVEYVEAHDNLVQGIGGMGDGSLVYRSEFYANGDQVAAGINSGAVKSGSTFTVVESYTHNNVGNGFWCDNDCNGTPTPGYSHDFVVIRSFATQEGRNGIRFEHGNGATSAEVAASTALIEDNVVTNNNQSCNSPGAGIEVNSAQNATVRFNNLGGTNKSDCSSNGGNGVAVRGSRHPLRNNTVTDNNLGARSGFSPCDKILFMGTGTNARNTCSGGGVR